MGAAGTITASRKVRTLPPDVRVEELNREMIEQLGWSNSLYLDPTGNDRCHGSVPADGVKERRKDCRFLGIWFYGEVKTTLEIPDDLFREMKATAALRGIKLRDFVTEAISGHLARMKRADSGWSRRLPPPPKVAKSEMRRIHQLIQEESERIDGEDWVQ